MPDSEYSILSPAKVNLHLSVGDVRNDGFHEITSIFQTIGIYDRIQVEISESNQNIIEISGFFSCPIEKNLIYRAAVLFLNELDSFWHLNFRIDKQIPEGGGLGGGSGNAASTLMMLNRAFGSPYEVDELAEMGSRLGSDVPFFFYQPAALVQGRGEIVTPIDAAGEFSLLLINPGLHINTKEAFYALDQSRSGRSGTLSEDPEDLIARYHGLPPTKWNFENDFLKAPGGAGFQRVVNFLYENGAVYANLSGSGASVYGLFGGIDDLDRCYFLAKHEFKDVRRTKLLARS